jgi:hypothetical protein
VYRTGKHRSRPNPDGPEVRKYPELAHMTPEEHTELLAVINDVEQESGAGQAKGRESPLWNRPRARSLWPGQHATCAICGGRMYRYGDFLRCQHSTVNSVRPCWNHVQVEYTFTHTKVLAWVMNVLNRQPAVRERVIQIAWSEFERVRQRHRRSGGSLQEGITDLEGQEKRLAKAIAKGGEMDALLAELAEAQSQLRQARRKLKQITQEVEENSEFSSQEDVAARLDEALARMTLVSLDFADFLRQLIPVFVIQPVQALDRPQVRPRAKLTLRLDAWTTQGETPFETSVELDLFEPPLHIHHLQACLVAKQACPEASLKEIAASLGINHMTVNRAFDYARRMEKEGMIDPYREIHEQPAQASRWGKRPTRQIPGRPPDTA